MKDKFMFGGSIKLLVEKKFLILITIALIMKIFLLIRLARDWLKYQWKRDGKLALGAIFLFALLNQVFLFNLFFKNNNNKKNYTHGGII